MSDQLQLRRGTTTQILAFTGAQGEVVVNTDTHALVVQDGATAGGFPTASSAQVTNGTFYYNENAGSAANAYILDAQANTTTPTAYLNGIQFGFVTTHPNTGPSSANFQSLGVKNLKFPGGVDPQPGDISGRVYLVYDATNGWMEIQRKATAPPPQLRSVTASVASSAMTVGLLPDIIDFRSSTLGSGTVNRRTLTAALSLVIPSGATLGTQNAIQSQIAILAIDNAGTVQLGVVNMAGGINLDETTLINTTAITSGSTSSTVVYSSSAVSGAPFRVVGFVQSTQATAGTWATVPSEIQGQGGQAIIGGSKITLAVSQPTTSGTAIDYTGIPAGVKRITLMFNQLSTNGAGLVLLQLGAGSVQATGYIGGFSLMTGGVATSSFAGTGFAFAGGATSIVTGTITLNLSASNTWTCSGSMAYTNSAGTGLVAGSGAITGVVDRLRLTTTTGTDAFDSGFINILFEG